MRAPITFTTAHPRSRGENRAEIADLQTRAGSSPLTRGKRVRFPGDRLDRGLIPAHAGKTDGRLVGRVVQGAHPRSRGENPVFLEIPGKGTGSSPLTRGKRRIDLGRR